MLNTLTQLLHEQIQDLYNAENQLVKALPRMAKAASTPSLKEAFTNHLEETQGHVERLSEIAQLLEMKPTGKVCKAMKGLIEEGKEAIEEEGADAVLDAALIAAAQRVEHYEISAYGTARALAEQLGRTDVAEIFQEILDEEEACDETLTQLCTSEIYASASQAQEEEDDNSGSRAAKSKTRRND